VTILSLVLFNRYVELKPKVDEHFFFSSEDPQFQADRRIAKIFPLPDQIILSAKGDIESKAYRNKMEEITSALAALPHVSSVQSMTRGPHSIYDARRSDLWKRFIISKDGEATFIYVNFPKDLQLENVYRQVEEIKDQYDAPDFKLMISGAAYIVELIRRYLLQDMQVFSLTAFCLFGLALFVIFRSFFILLGILIACLNSAAITLILTQVLDFHVGPLTANLSTIVFVLTLTHMVFMTFNWKHIRKLGETSLPTALEAVKMTFRPSFWSMATTCLGFFEPSFCGSHTTSSAGNCGCGGHPDRVFFRLWGSSFFPAHRRLKAHPRKTNKDTTPSRFFAL